MSGQQNLTSHPSLPKDIKNQLIALYNQGKLEHLIHQVSGLTNDYPNSILLWNLLGIANADLSRSTEAITAFETAILLKPDAADAHNNLGLAFHQKNDFEASIMAFNKAIQLKPNYPDALNNLGAALYQIGQFEEAIKSLERAISLKANYAEAYFNLGLAFQGQGLLEDAMEKFKKALSLNSNNFEAHKKLGDILTHQNRYAEAVKCYGKAIEILPRDSELHLKIGSALFQQGKFEDSLSAFKNAQKIKPECPTIGHKISLALEKQGRLEEAITTLQGILENHPGDANAHNNFGAALKDQGKFSDARFAFEKTLALNPRHAMAHRNLSELKTYSSSDPQIKDMEILYADPQLDEDSRCNLCFALAKAHEDLGNLDQTFEFLKQGNTLRKKILSYDISQDEVLFEKLQKAYPEIQNNTLINPPATNFHQPIFIVGMPRSGTTLIEQIISCHSKVYGAGELLFFSNYGANVATGLGEISMQSLLKLREKYLKQIKTQAPNVPFITDKAPHNFLFIALILSVFPEAKIIHVKRSAAATCWSNYKHYFPGNGLGYSNDLDDLARYYDLYRNLMALWDQIYGDHIYNIDYDQLTINQEIETRNLLKYLALDWEDPCLSPHQNKRPIRTASQQQVTQPVYRGSSENWRRFEPFIGGAFAGLID